MENSIQLKLKKSRCEKSYRETNFVYPKKPYHEEKVASKVTHCNFNRSLILLIEGCRRVKLVEWSIFIIKQRSVDKGKGASRFYQGQ